MERTGCDTQRLLARGNVPSVAALVGALALSLAGCVSHLPMSDAVMFHDKGRTNPAHANGFGAGMVVTQTVTPTGFLIDEARRRFTTSRSSTTTADPLNLGVRGKGAYMAIYDGGEFAISATVGDGLFGGDTTFKLIGRNYFTASASRGGLQFLLQHRAFNSAHLGAAAGIAYRKDFARFDVDDGIPSEAWCFSPCNERKFAVHSVGLTATVIGRHDARAPGPLRATVFAGYTPAFRKPMVTLGVALGVF